MANEQKIINDVKKAVDGLSTSFKALDDVLEKNMANQKDLIKNLQAIKTNLAGTKSLKEFVTLQKKMNDEQLKLNKTQQAAVDLARRNEQRKQQVIKTQQAAINASKKEQLANEQLKRSKMQTAAAEERAAKRKEKATRESREASRAYNVESKRLLELTKRAKNAAIQYGVNSKQARSLRKEQQKLDRQIKKVDASLGQHTRNVGNYKSAWGGVRNILGAAGIFGGTQLLVQGFKQAFNISRQYEKQNAVLAGVLGRTSDELGNLAKESRRLGKETAFSASEVVELQTELARLGKTEDQIIKMTGGIINATIALGSETSETAALVGATLNAFQLDASESANVADILTLSTQRSALSFEKLNTALPSVSAAANSVGLNLQQTVAMLGQAADRGIDASTAATSLRNIFIEVSKRGITLSDALEQINRSQNKVSVANELFGKRAISTALALAGATKETKNLTEALNDAGGTAQKVAETQLDTMDGKIRLLGSAWEGFAESIFSSKGFLAELAGDVIQFVTDVLNALTNSKANFEIFTKDLENFSDSTIDYILENGDALTKGGASIKRVVDETKKSYKSLDDKTKESTSIVDMMRDAFLEAGESIKTAEKIAQRFIRIDLQDAYKNFTPEQIKEEINKIQHDLPILEQQFKEFGESISEALQPDDFQDRVNPFKQQDEWIDEAKSKIADGPALSADDLITDYELFEAETRLNILLGLLSQTSEQVAPGGDSEEQVIMREMQLRDESLNQIKEFSDVQIEEAEKRATKLKEIDQSGFEAFKEIQERKKELVRENGEALYELGTELGNALFERRIEQYNQDLEANSAYYDNLLANQELSEEQRSLLEAKRLEKENEIRAKQRQAEKQQFLFQQAMKVGEIWMNASLAKAKITAAYAAIPGAIPAITAPLKALINTQAAIQTGIVLAQSIPQFAKGTDNAPGGAAIVGEKGTELVMSKDKKTAWLTDNKPQLTNLNKGDKVIPHNQLLDSINNYTNSQIVNNSDKITGNDELIGRLVSRMIDENSKSSKGIIKAIERNKPKQSRQSTIDRMRTDDLKSKLRN